MRRRALVASQMRSGGAVADEGDHEEEDPDDEEEENLTAGRSGARRRSASAGGTAELRSRCRTVVGPDGEAIEARRPGGVRRPGERVVGSGVDGMGGPLSHSLFLSSSRCGGGNLGVCDGRGSDRGGRNGSARPSCADQPGWCRRTRTHTGAVPGTVGDKFVRPGVERGCPIGAWLNCPMLRRTQRRRVVVGGDAGVWTALETGRGGVRYVLVAVGVVNVAVVWTWRAGGGYGVGKTWELYIVM
ncbi:glycine-rich cell wall structural protein-like [Iris pallida]|uniref:Glycine-rich cell wall structural protein-like n=1 Tax=Iris pallida TaxID=29817 RepID=A0AAX6I4D4_IRIPA|nr:glycine-rich cell wall structural protein-like [Iris pallida]